VTLPHEPPPPNPLAGPAPDPRVLTAGERDRLDELRDSHAWYLTQGRDDARVGDLLRVLDRLASSPEEPSPDDVHRHLVEANADEESP